MDDEFEATSPEAHRALANPMRHRLLMALRGEPATISQLARRLDVRKGSVAHHLKVLVAAGMARPSESRQVRGGTEQYYELAIGAVRGPDDPEATAAMLSAVATSVAADPDPLLHLRHVRLSAAQAAALRAELERIVEEVPSEPDAPTYGVLVSLYRRP